VSADVELQVAHLLQRLQLLLDAQAAADHTGYRPARQRKTTPNASSNRQRRVAYEMAASTEKERNEDRQR